MAALKNRNFLSDAVSRFATFCRSEQSLETARTTMDGAPAEMKFETKKALSHELNEVLQPMKKLPANPKGVQAAINELKKKGTSQKFLKLSDKEAEAWRKDYEKYRPAP